MSVPRTVRSGRHGYPGKDRRGVFHVMIAGYKVERVPGWEEDCPLFIITNDFWGWRRWYKTDGTPKKGRDFSLEIDQQLAAMLIKRFLYEEKLELQKYGYS